MPGASTSFVKDVNSFFSWDLFTSFTHCLLHNSCDVRSENVVLDNW